MDKFIHFTVGLMIAIAGCRLGYPVCGLALGITAGVAKEVVYDKALKKGTPDVADAIATASGAVMGYLAYVAQL